MLEYGHATLAKLHKLNSNDEGSKTQTKKQKVFILTDISPVM